MSEPLSIGLVAIGGYGNFYVRALLDGAPPEEYRIAGIVDPMAERSPRLDDLKQRGIPIYDTLGEFYAKHRADLVTIASPIHLHCPQTCEALANGSNVLCEKPLGATIQEAQAMIDARDAAGKFVAIGYQWSFCAAIQELKKDILSGCFGRPRRLRTIVLWPRKDSYYGRNAWAGALRNERGDWVLDSPVNNATAHYLHNMLYVIGDAVDRSARITSVQAELYRANPITNYDTGAAKIITDSGVELLYIASHPVSRQHGPEFIFEFENGTVRFGGGLKTVQAEFDNGTTKDYGDPQAAGETKLWNCMSAALGKGQIVCGPEAASAQTLCMNAMQESMPQISAFPDDVVKTDGAPGDQLTYVEGLDDALRACFEANQLPSEAGLPWARGGTKIDVTAYDEFPSPGYPA
ncbi:MAG: Gfo/Idh/MocA family oxidoreductase [Lentisphaerae bacterium]|jgi:predicted dehydrogenase|nr:Gfo/Idh/MocA family oxidoreductase [Lentisphaerota bacterium]MBT4815950.1 Gfo/Idh/MocA family oxidoreductase [Lentisphaerota bacterium]MBT5606870.1 Gfo/Idh/MocA family oxidoreductase [Lentisphaerota bacterium]MBT7059017.1 Gfo/Idh/MocA family oxidoreductase [Lentisphaerota bacterium]MBT7843589.1 Gfo/Idh/MocA family oxidoreductase [Lentisphaerota bacterium]